MKHAFLIIAHNEFDILQRLVTSLDHERIDFYIHIDKKVDDLPQISTLKSGCFFVKPRIDTRWGNVSQVKTEMALFEAANNAGEYEFYHIISGVHYPLVSTERILSYYESYIGKSVIDRMCTDAVWQEDIKIHRYNLFTRTYSYGPEWVRSLSQRLWRFTNEVQGRLGIRRYSENKFYKASNWVSLSNEAIKYLLDDKERILKKYSWTFCGDEYFVPTELMSSSLSSNLVKSDNLLYQIFGEANPRILVNSDFESIIASGCLFARKFSSLDMDILERIDKVRT